MENLDDELAKFEKVSRKERKKQGLVGLMPCVCLSVLGYRIDALFLSLVLWCLVSLATWRACVFFLSFSPPYFVH